MFSPLFMEFSNESNTTVFIRRASDDSFADGGFSFICAEP